MKRIFLLGLLPLFLLGVVRADNYEYVLDWEKASSHYYQVSLTASPASGTATDFQIPAWRPGRYILQNYAAAITDFQAKDAKGKSLKWQKVDKDTWRVQNPASGKVTVSYDFYANVLDAGSTYLGEDQAYFNGANIFMHIRDQYENPCTLTVKGMGKNWKAATALNRSGTSNIFSAPTYHDFVDAPTILSPTVKTLKTQIDGATFYFHFQGDYQGGADTDEALLENVGKIIREQTAIIGEMPLKEYHFIYQLMDYNMRHAVEHKYSSCFTLPATVTASPEALRGLYGITSHEFWHLWNVKRIRPAALWPYQYQEEAYTTLHWFTEGVTDYYTYLTMARAGLLDEEAYLDRLAKGLTRLENSHGAHVLSPSASSFNSWLAGSEWTDPHAQASYYPLGARVGMLIDLRMRGNSDGKKSLDDVFRYLYQEYYKKGLGVPENGIQAAIEKISGNDWDDFFNDFVHGTEDISYPQFLSKVGVRVKVLEDTSATYEKIGLQRIEKLAYGIYVRSVDPGSDAYRGGLGDKDIITLIDGKSAAEADLDEVFGELKKGDIMNFQVFSGGMKRDISVKFTGGDLPKKWVFEDMKKLKKKAKKIRKDWLASQAK